MRRGIVAFVALALASPTARSAEPPLTFDVSYVAGTRDATGHVMGGTEIRNLVVHDGRLFAANGFWKDPPGVGGSAGAQILVLDAAAAPWRIDHEFGELLPGGRRRHLAISALSEITFHTDSKGAALSRPVPVLLASSWDVTGRR